MRPMIASFNVTSQCGLAPSECPVVGSGRASASRIEDKLEDREMLFCVTDGRFGFVYSYHATTFAFRHPRIRPRPAPPVSQSPQRLEPDCGDPTETQAPDRRHITPKLPSPCLHIPLRVLGEELLDLGHLVLVGLVLVRPVPRQLRTPPLRAQRRQLTSCRHACRSGSGGRQTGESRRGPCR